MFFITQGKTNLRYILIVVVLAVIVGGGIFIYQRCWIAEKEMAILMPLTLSLPQPTSLMASMTFEEYEAMLRAAPDHDEDDIATADDNCPLTANPDQSDNDGDGFPGSEPGLGDMFGGDACDPDDDNDGVLDVNDNCPFISNPDKTDTDADGIGDACDPDNNGGGILDSVVCPFLRAFFDKLF